MWDTYKIEVIPTLIAFSKGKIVARKDGVPQVGLQESDLLELDSTLDK